MRRRLGALTCLAQVLVATASLAAVGEDVPALSLEPGPATLPRMGARSSPGALARECERVKERGAATGSVADGQPPPPPDPWVRHLDFEGNAHLSDAQLSARISTEGKSWVPFTRRHTFDEAAFGTDLARIERLYRAEGYYQARVVRVRIDHLEEPRPEESRAGKVDVTIVIDEGPLTRVAWLDVAGIEMLEESERRAILDRFPLKVGDPMVEAKFDEGRAYLVEALHELGFAEAAVREHAQIFAAEAEADVSYRAQPGERFTIGAINVIGLSRVAEHLVLEQARTELPEGARFSESALKAAEVRIASMGVFGSVRVARGAPDRDSGRIAIDIQLREAPFRTLRLGAGVHLDPKRQELPRIWGSWTHRDLFGGLRRFTAAAELALVFTGRLFDGVDKPRPAGALELGFAQPALFGPDLSLDVTLGYERGIVERELYYDAALARVGVPWRVGDRLTFIPSFNFSLARFHVPTGLESLSDEIEQEMALDACAREGRLCRLAYLEQRLVYDRRDSPIAPTRGYWLGISLQEGGRFLGGAYDYLRLMPEARVYLPLGPHVLALRAMFGLIHTFGGASSSVLTRFFLGGASNQRGFGNQGLSPRLALGGDVRDGEIDDADAIAIGGNAMIAGNVELRFRLPANFGVVVFCDAGEVVLDIDDLKADALQVAVGLGLRYQTIFGPVRLDFGYRVTHPDLQVETVGELGAIRLVGLPRWSLLISLGEAF